MAKFRIISPRIWNDAKFKALSDNGKLVFFMLLTHPYTSAIGTLRAYVQGLAAELGWTEKAFREAFAKAFQKTSPNQEQEQEQEQLKESLSHTNGESINIPPAPQQPKGKKAGYEREQRQSDLSTNPEDEPSIEFVELREFYDREARPEGPRTGWIEFKRLKHQTGKTGSGYFPGIYRLMDDISARIANGFWDKGYEPGLARYLNERIWEQEATSRRKPENKTFEERAEDAERARRDRIRKRLKAIQDGDNEKTGG